MQNYVNFFTGSQFVGNYNTALNCMDGYGIYIYPDGSEYRGYFKNGKFHGNGQIVLGKPFSFTFIGTFENGKLMQLSDMFYNDGLRLKANFENTKFNVDDWKYCSGTDRRFAWEILHGLEPAGQQVIMTSLKEGDYDVGGGIYKENSGFLVRIPPPFVSIRFLACDKERNWILRNCRKGPCDRDEESHPPIEPITEISKEIIDTNMKEFQIFHSCICNKPHLSRFDCTHPMEESISTERSTRSHCLTSKSTSISSFYGESIQVIDIAKNCQEELDTLKLNNFEKKSNTNPEIFHIIP